MSVAIEWEPRGRKDLDGLDHEVSRRVCIAVERLAAGHGSVRRLTGIDPPFYRLR